MKTSQDCHDAAPAGKLVQASCLSLRADLLLLPTAMLAAVRSGADPAPASPAKPTHPPRQTADRRRPLSLRRCLRRRIPGAGRASAKC